MTTYLTPPMGANPVPVVVLTLNGEYVSEYESVHEAAKRLGVDSQRVFQCLSGRNLRAGDYLVVKKESYNPDVKITYAALLRKRKFLKRK